MQIKRFVNLCPHIVFVPIFILTIFVAVNTHTFFLKKVFQYCITVKHIIKTVRIRQKI